MKEADVLKCQIQEWYPRFRGVTIRTIVLEVPEEFVEYLLEDGVFLSRGSEAMPARTVITCPQLQSEDYDRWSEEDEEGEAEVPAFPELEERVKEAIEKLGGAVFPKLNWSAPKDTTWISTSGNLQCRNFGEICLLLKASDNVSHDLCNAFDGCEDQLRKRPDSVVLGLRKWYDLRPELEFRAFVFRGLLVGICQREVTGFYPSLVGREDELEFAIADFFHEHIRQQFEVDSYAFDCYVKRDCTVKLLDFNPWRGSTLPLLFSWVELEENHARVSAEIDRVHARFREAADLESVGGALGAVTLASCGDSGFSGNGNMEKDVGDGAASESVKDDRSSGHEEYRVMMRIVMSEGLVQPGMRIGTGIPFDFVDRGNWEEVIRREAAQEAQREQAAAGA